MNLELKPPLVTVVIPAFNAHSTLPACLHGLSAQTYPATEVIVVDNGSSPSLRALVEKFPGVAYVLEPRPGSYAARNLGIREAGGDVLAFTDADCIPAPDWIERGVARLLENPRCGLVGGRIQLTFHKPHAPSLWEFADFLSHGDFPQQHFVEHDGFAATANAFITREAMETVGPFNAEFMSGGDRDWGHRATAAGFALTYAPDAVVAHPARTQASQLVRKSRRLQGGVRDFELRNPTPKAPVSFRRRLVPVFVWRLRDARRRIKSYPSLVGHPLRLSPLVALGTVGVVGLLRLARTLESLRLTLGGASFRG